MSMITHPGTGFAVGDPDLLPLSADRLPSAAEIGTAASSLILSASGWRKVFAACGAEDGDEDSDSGAVSPADTVLAGAAAIAFAGLLRSRSTAKAPSLLVGIDSRPTGPAIADAMIRVFIGLGLSPRYLFIVAAPEIMAYARVAGGAGDEDAAAGFVYVSASHNPRGHNGLKFGLVDGGVLGAADSGSLIESYRGLLADPSLAARVLSLIEAAESRDVARVFTGCSLWKRRSISAYTLFAREVVAGTADPRAQDGLFDEMAEGAARRPVGVVSEFNGSARCLSIDRDFLEGLGVRTRAVNDRPRDFAHRIVPEGDSLADAMRELEAAAAADPSFAAAYVPDCDGDRGNLVVLGKAGGGAGGRGAKARPLEAQEVFALACVAELSQLIRDGRLSYDEEGNAREKAAVVVNDATSMRINAIARVFDVDVFRAETGEANVVGLAASLRARGYLVRILGEGSNGGNITHPSSVRDPLATLGALLKLLLVRGGSGSGGAGSAGEGLFAIWMRRSGRPYDEDFGIDEILASLPAFSTTSVFEPRAAFRVKSGDQAALKARYATLFLGEWRKRGAELKARFGVASWEAFATNGQAEIRVGADFAASGRGGLRIALADESGRPRAFLWMRGSGTESVFRVMADVEGGKAADEEYLLAWHAALVREADRV
ncbi:MAG: phosphatidylglycerol lysyltransferase [Rectinemataceae bacterium]|jgi:phosphoglucomutase